MIINGHTLTPSPYKAGTFDISCDGVFWAYNMAEPMARNLATERPPFVAAKVGEPMECGYCGAIYRHSPRTKPICNDCFIEDNF